MQLFFGASPALAHSGCTKYCDYSKNKNTKELTTLHLVSLWQHWSFSKETACFAEVHLSPQQWDPHIIQTCALGCFSFFPFHTKSRSAVSYLSPPPDTH